MNLKDIKHIAARPPRAKNPTRETLRFHPNDFREAAQEIRALEDDNARLRAIREAVSGNEMEGLRRLLVRVDSAETRARVLGEVLIDLIALCEMNQEFNTPGTDSFTALTVARAALQENK